ncbi:hypothetical protein CU084_17075 [Bacillus velezensis]|nr:hypothetical protein CU084_17075 [Bacillus velezensis]
MIYRKEKGIAAAVLFSWFSERKKYTLTNGCVSYINVLRYELNGAFIDSFFSKKAFGTSL